MHKRKKKNGFTLAEMLIVVAIIVILAGVAFIAVHRYQRSLAQLERNKVAEEIFVAAQNHLTMAKSQGFLGVTDYGNIFNNSDDEVSGGGASTGEGTETSSDIYYYTVVKGVPDKGKVMFDLMLPFGSIDENVRGGDSYIVRYQITPVAANVLDVYYMPSNGRFLSGLTPATAFEKGDGKTAYDNDSVLGWYGGEEAKSLQIGTPLKTPTITINNAEKLTVIVHDPNSKMLEAESTGESAQTASLKIIITGKSSGAQKSFLLRDKGVDTTDSFWTVFKDDDYIITLDDITAEGKHFANIVAEIGLFYPGEDISVEAVAFHTTHLTNVAYSGPKTTNSLFAEIQENDNGVYTTASVANIRHLENLSKDISKVSYNGEIIAIKEAEQINDLDWNEFKNKITDTDTTVTETPGATSTPLPDENDTVSIYSFSGTPTKGGCYMPVDATMYALKYDGSSHSISNITIDNQSYAGLFGSLASNSEIKNIKLVDFEVKTGSDGGALIGKATSVAIENVIAVTTETNPDKGVSATGNAGGLAGYMESGSVKNCAASVYVKSENNNAGGLIGHATQNASVEASYSGGHTKNGSYKEAVEDGRFDIIGKVNVGGLIGYSENSTVAYCYSTCSVSVDATGDAGGLIGETTNSKVYNCYSTGLIELNPMEDGHYLGAFIGLADGDTTINHSYYYDIINEYQKSDSKEFAYLPPVGNNDSATGISALDENVSVYDSFVGGKTPASPYDSTLAEYYQANYFLKNVFALQNEGGVPEPGTPLTAFVKTHYGDWPAPEIFIINTPAS